MAASTANVTVINLTDGRQVCLSYGVIVAAFIPRTWPKITEGTNHLPSGYLRTDARFSVTSSKHATQFAGKDAARIPHETLKALCAPIESRE